MRDDNPFEIPKETDIPVGELRHNTICLTPRRISMVCMMFYFNDINVSDTDPLNIDIILFKPVFYPELFPYIMFTDYTLTDITFILICKGRTSIGRVESQEPQDIVIQGTGIERQHCYIVNEGGAVTLYPLAILCTVDGLQCNRPTRLSQG